MPAKPSRAKGWITTLMVISLTSCSEGGTSPFDWSAPAAISDLAVTDSLGTSVTLIWTASGDNNQTGSGAEYDLRHAMWPITEARWDNADQVAGVPAPEVVGTIQEMVVTDLAWWTRYYFALRVADEAGNWSSISNVVAASPYPEAGLRFLVGTRVGIFAVDMDASLEFFDKGTEVEVMGDSVYTGYPYFAALPGHRFALMSNMQDSIYFIDDAGNLLAAVGMLEAPDDHLQNLDGVVVGDALIISEDGNKHLLRVDLNTYEMSVFKDLSGLSGWLGAIDYRAGYYYICQARKIYRFQESGHPELIVELEPELYNITGIVVAGGHSFVTLNFAGAIYRVNNRTGQATRFLQGLDYPEDLELMGR